jgi:hypothetical protein
VTYQVIWMPPAEERLAAIWLASSNRNAITHAAHDIDVVLEVFPNAAGECEFDTVREYANSHLTVEFEVVESDRCVYVLNVWDTANGRPKVTGN